MSPLTKYLIAGLVIAVIALWLLPPWLAALIVVALVAAPIVAYLMLDPAQRRRLRRVSRKQLGR